MMSGFRQGILEAATSDVFQEVHKVCEVAPPSCKVVPLPPPQVQWGVRDTEELKAHQATIGKNPQGLSVKIVYRLASYK